MQANEVTSTLVEEVCCSPAMVVDTQAMIPSRPSDNGRPTDRPIAVVVDLCLYRVVTDRCSGQVLPFGVRQTIKDYAWVSFDNETLRAAVRLWCSDRATAYDRYGNINDWDVSKVTDMTRLFKATKFNDRIDRWDVRNVTSMQETFRLATDFNQTLDTWDARHVATAHGMFMSATSFNQPLSSWDVSHMTQMLGMFFNARAFNQPLDTWDVSQVTDMGCMFYGATSFNQPLDTWRVSPDTDMWSMFKSAGCCPSMRKIS
jgi:surface protein